MKSSRSRSILVVLAIVLLNIVSIAAARPAQDTHTKAPTHKKSRSRKANGSNNTISTAGGGGFFDSLQGKSSPSSNFIIPNLTGPQGWSCTYMNRQIQPSAAGITIPIGKSQNGGRKPFSCGELISRENPKYGTYSVDMISSNVRGHVTGFFLIALGATEIDIELTGLDSTIVHLNVWKGSTQHPVPIKLGFDASKGWHNYAMEWRKNFIAWYVDGKLVYKRSDVSTANPQSSSYRLALNSWTNNVEDGWAGKFSWPRSGKAQSQFRNLKYAP
ncbi:concanavalin A-like lectin/glucanase domain-containing protein [Mortierella sp. GBAus27b]|nr:hypothetical protein BGX31_006971 [Mortierella sp. GBA43]KAI8354429.1 concanavalin A-like lectin/glucanase domain-containing protein [Mortierella sp. GBAus27b]